jgi:hypothetical protein
LRRRRQTWGWLNRQFFRVEDLNAIQGWTKPTSNHLIPIHCGDREAFMAMRSRRAILPSDDPDTAKSRESMRLNMDYRMQCPWNAGFCSIALKGRGDGDPRWSVKWPGAAGRALISLPDRREMPDRFFIIWAWSKDV